MIHLLSARTGLQKAPSAVTWRWKTEPIGYKLTLQFPLLLLPVQHPQLHQKHRNQYKHEVFFLFRKQFMAQKQAERTNTALCILAVYHKSYSTELNFLNQIKIEQMGVRSQHFLGYIQPTV